MNRRVGLFLRRPGGPDGRPPGRGLTVIEIVIAVALLSLLMGAAFWVFVYGGRSTSRLTKQLSLQQASRKAIVRFLREVQEGMEVLSPRPGSTLSYALVRDKVSLVRWFYQVPQGAGANPLYELWRYLDDPDTPADRRAEPLLRNVRRLTFTSRSEGALQVNLILEEEDQQYSILTTVRLRNLPSAEEVW